MFSLRSAVTCCIAFLSTSILLLADPTAYISLCCNIQSNIPVVSIASGQSVQTLYAGVESDGIALLPDGSRAYVTSDALQTVSVFGTGSAAILATISIPTGQYPSSLQATASPDGTRVYITSNFSSPSAIFAIDTKTNAIVATVKLAQGTEDGIGPVVSPDSKYVYVVDQLNLLVIDAATCGVVKTISVGEYATGLAVTSTGLVLLPDADDELNVVDPSSGTIAARIALPGKGVNLNQPGPVIASPDGTVAYVAFQKSLLPVSIANGPVQDFVPIPLGAYVNALAITPDGSRVLAANNNATVSVVDTRTGKQTAVYAETSAVPNLAISPDGQSAYIVTNGDSAVAAADVSTTRLTYVLAGGNGLGPIAESPTDTTTWVTNSGYGSPEVLSIVDNQTDKLIGNVPGLGSIQGFSPDGSYAYFIPSQSLLVLDRKTLTKVAAVPYEGPQAPGPAIPSPDGSHVYVDVTLLSGKAPNGANQFWSPGYISVVPTSTFKEAAEVNLPYGAGAPAITPDGSSLLVTGNYGKVQVINTTANKVTSVIQLRPANGFLGNIAVAPNGSKAYVIDTYYNLVQVIDLSNFTVSATIPVKAHLSGIVAYTPDSTKAYVGSGDEFLVFDTTSNAIVGSLALPAPATGITFSK